MRAAAMKPSLPRTANKWRGLLRLVGVGCASIPNGINKHQAVSRLKKILGGVYPDDLSKHRDHFDAFADVLTRYIGKPVPREVAQKCVENRSNHGYEYTDVMRELLGERPWPPERADLGSRRARRKTTPSRTHQPAHSRAPGSPANAPPREPPGAVTRWGESQAALDLETIGDIPPWEEIEYYFSDDRRMDEGGSRDDHERRAGRAARPLFVNGL